MENIEIYEKKILEYNIIDIINENVECENCIKYSASFQDCSLELDIDKSTHIIKRTSINKCGNDPIKLCMMKAFCKVISGLPILEANDHGVLKLENILRGNMVHKVKGIIMPENSCKLFMIPLNLIRQIYIKYSKEQNYSPLVNAYMPKEIREWKKMDILEREKIVYKLIDAFAKKHNIKDYETTLIGDVRVEFITEKNDSLAKLLLDLEINISKELGFSLEVMFTEKQDTNKKRKN